MKDYFKDEELAQPERHGFKAEPYPAAWADRKAKLKAVLNAIRERLDRPVLVLSAYRSEAYNRKIGGARNSQHVQGRAADIKVPGMSAAKVHAVVLQMYQAGELPQLGGLGLYPTFVHVDVRPSKRLARWSGSRL